MLAAMDTFWVPLLISYWSQRLLGYLSIRLVVIIHCHKLVIKLIWEHNYVAWLLAAGTGTECQLKTVQPELKQQPQQLARDHRIALKVAASRPSSLFTQWPHLNSCPMSLMANGCCLVTMEMIDPSGHKQGEVTMNGLAFVQSSHH